MLDTDMRTDRVVKEILPIAKTYKVRQISRDYYSKLDSKKKGAFNEYSVTLTPNHSRLNLECPWDPFRSLEENKGARSDYLYTLWKAFIHLLSYSQDHNYKRPNKAKNRCFSFGTVEDRKRLGGAPTPPHIHALLALKADWYDNLKRDALHTRRDDDGVLKKFIKPCFLRSRGVYLFGGKRYLSDFISDIQFEERDHDGTHLQFQVERYITKQIRLNADDFETSVPFTTGIKEYAQKR